MKYANNKKIFYPIISIILFIFILYQINNIYNFKSMVINRKIVKTEEVLLIQDDISKRINIINNLQKNGYSSNIMEECEDFYLKIYFEMTRVDKPLKSIQIKQNFNENGNDKWIPIEIPTVIKKNY